MLRKAVIGGIFAIGAIIFGFIMLLRGCLAKYDERSAISTPVVVEENGKAVVFSLVKFDKTTSYSQNGGFTRKSVNTSYYIQNNDAVTAARLQSKKIKSHRQIKSFPVEILGLSNKKVWVYAGELMAFDPFTLETIADKDILEQKNSVLKGKLPAERRYYEFDPVSGSIDITATDGMIYSLSTASLLTLAAPNDKGDDPAKRREKEIKQQIDGIRKLNEQNYDRYRNANDLYAQKKISGKAYQDSMERFQQERKIISDKEDSLRSIANNLNEEMNVARDQEQLKNSLKGSKSFSQMKVNSDSFNHQWYGLYTAEGIESLREQFNYNKTYEDVQRNKLYTASLALKDPSKPNSLVIGTVRRKLADAIYLNGGFLLDINTGKPIHLADGFLVVSKEQIGNEAKIILSRVGTDGKQYWSISTGLKEFSYWTLLDGRFYIFGVDNKELSSNDINVLHIIDLKTGGKVTHDYFKDKNR